MSEKYIPSIAEQLKAEIQMHSICCGPDFDEYDSGMSSGLEIALSVVEKRMPRFEHHRAILNINQCKHCNGSGWNDYDCIQICGTCKGKGV